MEKLNLKKLRIAKLNNLAAIKGGDGGNDPKKSNRPGCPTFTQPGG